MLQGRHQFEVAGVGSCRRADLKWGVLWDCVGEHMAFSAWSSVGSGDKNEGSCQLLSPGHLGPIVTEVTVLLPGRSLRDNPLTPSKSDSERAAPWAGYST